MRLLVLGGTLFVGRHLVEAALARGHEVTRFSRGELGTDPGVRGFLSVDISKVLAAGLTFRAFSENIRDTLAGRERKFLAA